MSKRLKQNLAAYGMVIPAFLVVMLTVTYPIISAVIQSFQDEKPVSLRWTTMPTSLRSRHS